MADEKHVPEPTAPPSALVQAIEPMFQMVRDDTFGKFAAALPTRACTEPFRELAEVLRWNPMAPVADNEFAGLVCARCGTARFVSVSLDGGWTRLAQCVPCGRIHETWRRPGWRASRG